MMGSVGTRYKSASTTWRSLPTLAGPVFVSINGYDKSPETIPPQRTEGPTHRHSNAQASTQTLITGDETTCEGHRHASQRAVRCRVTTRQCARTDDPSTRRSGVHKGIKIQQGISASVRVLRRYRYVLCTIHVEAAWCVIAPFRSGSWSWPFRSTSDHQRPPTGASSQRHVLAMTTTTSPVPQSLDS